MTRIAVLVHSRGGKTRRLADAVARGARAVEGTSVTVHDVGAGADRVWEALSTADAIVFGCPTFMGGVSAELKAVLDASARLWAVQGLRDKVAAGFTHSSAPSGDKLATLLQLAVFAAQHGMIWVGVGLPPPFATARDTTADLNRLGSHLGAMAQSRERDAEIPPGDLATAEHLGRRVAEVTSRLRGEERDARARHPTTRDWALPDPSRAPLPEPLSRTNLRALAARPDRFEHHLVVVATIGGAQLEIATASEPLYFGHVNLSDELTIALPTGDALVDGFPLRTFVLDTETAELVGRYNHRPLDLVLHPYGFMHWPGMLRPPYAPFDFPRGSRRAGLVLVACASKLTGPGPSPAPTTEARREDVKLHDGKDAPLSLVELPTGGARPVGEVAGGRLELLVAPRAIAPARGGYVVVLEADPASDHAPADLVHVPPGARFDADGIARALLFSSPSADASPPPASWVRLPGPPIAPFEEGPRGELPLRVRELRLTAISDTLVSATLEGASARDAEIPRYWLARMLFRVALHGFRIGYVECYEGFYWDDRDGSARIGVRGVGEIVVSRDEAPEIVERIYRAVAPPGYEERLA